ALRQRLRGGAEVVPDLVPNVVDLRRQTLIREERHAVAGEPREEFVRGALQVIADVALERLVIDDVEVDLNPGLARGLFGQRLLSLFHTGIRVVRPDGDQRRARGGTAAIPARLRAGRRGAFL